MPPIFFFSGDQMRKPDRKGGRYAALVVMRSTARLESATSTDETIASGYRPCSRAGFCSFILFRVPFRVVSVVRG